VSSWEPSTHLLGRKRLHEEATAECVAGGFRSPKRFTQPGHPHGSISDPGDAPVMHG
jgi:hypothetical protein